MMQVESRLGTALKVQKEKAELAALKEGPKPIDGDAASLKRLAENFSEEPKKRKLSTAQVADGFKLRKQSQNQSKIYRTWATSNRFLLKNMPLA